MLEYAEKRDFIRMTMACDMTLTDPATGTTESVHLEDLSATGMRFFSNRELPEGLVLDAEITPCKTITPPMQAKVVVLRSTETDDQRFEVAASIEAIHPADYPEAESA